MLFGVITCVGCVLSSCRLQPAMIHGKKNQITIVVHSVMKIIRVIIVSR
jgi:hypothetical protein